VWLSGGSLCPIPYAWSVTVSAHKGIYTLMTHSVQQVLTSEQIGQIGVTISSARLATYLVAAGHDMVRAFDLYLWNAQLGEAFHTPIQAVEVGLRNRINVALSNLYTPNWWECANFQRILDAERNSDLVTVFKRIRNKKLELCTDQVVAGLSLGFWVGLLDGSYNAPIWSRQLRIAFPSLPTGRGRKSLFNQAGKIATLRNRISHHEPLIRRNISQDFSDVMTMLEWICPAKTDWVRPKCRVPAVLRLKP
jgi:hypothetical protein